MIRNCKYCIYKGQEYNFSSGKTSSYIIRSNKIENISDGWRKIERNNSYVKDVKLEEIENPIRVCTRAVYLGHTCYIIKETDSKFLLMQGDDGILAEKLGFKGVRGEREKWIYKDDSGLEKIYEDVSPLIL